ncbi:MAG: nickel-dependent lactate racemase [Chloroflexi bacterium]|nr:nickel-dependent lactate racemase [Chloroflexota bacterium]
MRVKLAYGKDGLWVELPDRNVTVVEPGHVPGLVDEAGEIRRALRSPIGAPPLGELVGSDDTVAIIFSDITRPQPRDRMLPVLLEELSHVPREQIVLVNALGTHRPNTGEELAEMLGRDVWGSYRVVQHDAFDEKGLAHVGKTPGGNRLSVNADYMRARVKILTGFIEPHFFAGFSGGPKAVLPGVANQEAVLANHRYEMLANSRACWGSTRGNPVWEEMLAGALLTSPAFLLNVTLNRDKQITGVFAGDLELAHGDGTRFVRETALAPVREPFDIVITSNSGYPLDLNLYQAVKGMSAAAQVVRPGGSIIVAAECWDGVPDHGEYRSLLRMASSPGQMLEVIRAFPKVRQDQWQAQIQAQVQLKAQVYVKSAYLDDEVVREAMLQPCASIEGTVEELLYRYGHDARICVLPEGPMTIPYVALPDRGGS